MKKYVDGLIAFLKWMKPTPLQIQQNFIIGVSLVLAYNLGTSYNEYVTKNYQGRSPLPRSMGGAGINGLFYPPFSLPFYKKDKKKYFQDHRKEAAKHTFHKTNYQVLYSAYHAHPQRHSGHHFENDAMYDSMLKKMMEEKLHLVALKLVERGVFANVAEAKRSRRDYLIENSDYEFKHLVYRNN